MNFITQPEISQSGCDTTFDLTNAIMLFNQNLTEDTHSMLNPATIFMFQLSYETGDFASIENQFNLSELQADCLYSYFA